MRGVAHVNRADGGPRLAVHTGDRRDGRRVRQAVYRIGQVYGVTTTVALALLICEGGRSVTGA